jgi:site-specific recombinase XerD
MSTKIQSNLGHTLSVNLFQDFIPDWANQFYQAKKSEGVSTYTLRFYKQQLNHFINFCDGQLITKVNEITPNIIRQFLLWHQEAGHNPGGLHAAFRVLRTFLLWYENEVEPEDWKNPIHKIKAPKLPERILNPVDIQDVFSMVGTCKSKTVLDYRDKAILLFLLDTGVRARELLNMNLSDINLMDGSIIIQQGKGNKQRIVFLGKKSRKALRAYLRHRQDNNPSLWITDDIDRLAYPGLRKIIVRRAKLAGVNQPSLHSFRRAFAINMLRAGVDVFSLQKLMGHADLQVLRRYLAQTTEDIALAHRIGSPVDNNKI